MKRLIFGMLAFFLTFGISVVLVGLVSGFPELSHESSHSDSRTVRNITLVLDQDIRIGERRRMDEIRIKAERSGYVGDEALLFADSGYSKVVGTYSKRASVIDVSQTPADFQYAWKKHMAAWKAHTSSLEKYSDEKTEPSSVYATSAEINSTWRQVLRIADRYGVTIKRRYLQ